jgi:hypothetical protein
VWTVAAAVLNEPMPVVTRLQVTSCKCQDSQPAVVSGGLLLQTQAHEHTSTLSMPHLHV